jgi:thiopeptide-type bacteriocin biosynthesis protein
MTSHAPSSASLFEPAGFFVLRTPLLPRAALAALAPDGPAPDAEHLDGWIAAHYARAVDALDQVVRRPDVRDAIFLASPSLDGSIDAWLARSPKPPDAADLSLRRYVQRMASRATPFGLFAGVSVGTTGERTSLTLPDRAAYRRHTRIDARFLRAVADAVSADPELRDELVYIPSSTLYRAAGRLRYAEAQGDAERRGYHLVAVDPSDALELILARSAPGAPRGALIAALVEAFAPEVGPDDAGAFVDEVIATQILVPRLSPALTGDEPVHAMLAELATCATERARRWHAALARAQTAIAELDAAPIGAPRARYRAIFGALRELTTSVSDRNLLQVDLIKPGARPELGRDVLDEILRAVDALHRIARPASSPLAEFAQRFRARYEDREVPLVDALDDENGIGFGASQPGASVVPPLLAGLPFAGSAAAPARAWTAQDDALLQRLAIAWRAGAHTIELTDDDLARLGSGRALERPLGMAATVIVLGSPQAIAAGDFRVFLRSVAAPSAAALLGRFCHSDPAIEHWTRKLVDREQAHEPDAILAEIVHQPQGVMGNVACRPVLRDFEIVYLGASGAPADRRIPIDDLLVSEHDGQIVLRSRRLAKRILPRLASAHNYAVNAAAIYHFLCALQTDRGTAPYYQWDWGPLVHNAFLPRVSFGRVILSPARWRLDTAPLRAGKTMRARFEAVQAVRRTANLPRHLKLAQADNELAVDLDDVLSVEAAIGALPSYGGLALFVEQLAPDDALAAHGPDGAFDHEIVVPFVRRAAVPRTAAARVTHPGRRAALPGSDWLYLKIYGGSSTLERVFSEAIAPIVRAERARGLLTRWFFIRYADPDWHFRLRFRGPPEHLHGAVLPAIERALRGYHDAGALRRVTADTYEPELERYGGPEGIELAETMFEADSDAVLAIMASHAADRPERWRLALLGMHDTLDALGLALDHKLALTRANRDGFARELGAGVATQKALGQRFRHERATIERLVLERTDDAIPTAIASLDARRETLRQVAARLHAAIEAGRIARPLADLAAAYVHMWVNRSVHSASREQEFVLHDLLTRTYEGMRARGRA